MKIRFVPVTRAAFIACITFASAAAHAQTASTGSGQAYPVKPLRVVIGGSPGSNADIFFRLVQPRMGAALGQQLIVDYRPGAGGALGAGITVKSPAAGYTIMMVAAGFVMNPALTKTLPYNPAADFTALGLVADVPAGLVVHPSLPAGDVRQLIALARSRPGVLNYGSAGQGSVSHLAGVLFNLLAKVNTVHVPYKSSGPSLVDLIAGEMAFSFPTVSGALQHVHSGKLRLLAQTGMRRSAMLKDTPTVQEAGLPGFVVNSGFGLVGPGGHSRSRGGQHQRCAGKSDTGCRSTQSHDRQWRRSRGRHAKAARCVHQVRSDEVDQGGQRRGLESGIAE